jgi:ribosomal protein S27AE
VALWRFLGACGDFAGRCREEAAASMAATNAAEERLLLREFLVHSLTTRRAGLTEPPRFPNIGAGVGWNKGASGGGGGGRVRIKDDDDDDDGDGDGGGSGVGVGLFWHWVFPWEACPRCFEMVTHHAGEARGLVDRFGRGVPPLDRCPRCGARFGPHHQLRTVAEGNRRRCARGLDRHDAPTAVRRTLAQAPRFLFFLTFFLSFCFVLFRFVLFCFALFKIIGLKMAT